MTKSQYLRNPAPPLPTSRLAVSIAELSAMSSISQASIYNAITRGDLKVRKIAARTVILVSDALEWLEGKPVVDAAEDAQDRADVPVGDAAATTEEGADAGEEVRNVAAK